MRNQIASAVKLLRSFFAAIFYGAAYVLLWVCDFSLKISVYLDPYIENDN